MKQAEQHFAITGAGSGIGRAIAIRLAAEGARLSLFGRRSTPLEETMELALEDGASQVMWRGCDVSDRSVIEAAFHQSVDELGQFRGVIANAGIGGPNEDGPKDRFDTLTNVNLKGAYYTLRAAEKRFFPGPQTRHMVVISSCLARFGVSGYTGYCASKAGLLGLVRAMALEQASKNIRVNAICPGWVNTDMAHEGIAKMAEAMNKTHEEAIAIALKAVPLRRMNEPEDIAGMLSWLVSDDANGVTGQGLDINAGSWMG